MIIEALAALGAFFILIIVFLISWGILYLIAKVNNNESRVTYVESKLNRHFDYMSELNMKINKLQHKKGKKKNG